MKPPGNPYTKQCEHIVLIWHRRGAAKHIFGVERWLLLFISSILLVMPITAVRALAGLSGSVQRRKSAVETYAVLKVVFLFIMLLWPGGPPSFGLICAPLFLVELFLYLIGIVLLRDFWSRPASYSRSLILLAVNFGELVVAFAVMYLHTHSLASSAGPVTDWRDALYFSVVTSATVGYGDLTPIAGIGRGIATGQILASLAFMAVILTHFVSKIENDRLPTRNA